MEEIKKNSAEAEKPEKAEAEQLFTKEQVDELMGRERQEWQQKLIEAEKLAKMDAQQKAAYQKQQLEKSLAEREAAVSRRELAAEALEKLSEYKLPRSLAPCVNLSSPEECEKSIQGLREAFSQAVSTAVNDRIRGTAPKRSAGAGSDAFLDGLCM